MSSSKPDKTYAHFYDTVRNNDILEPKITVLVHLATAIAFGCGS